MKNSVPGLLVCLMLLSLNIQNAVAGLIVLNPSKDGSIYSENNNATNGTGDLYVGRTGTTGGLALRRSLIAFDFSAIPAGSIINAVTLQLKVKISADNPDGQVDLLSLHRLSSNWGESNLRGGGNAGANALLNDATWSSAFYNNTAWMNNGGDFESQPSGTVALSRQTGNPLLTRDNLFTYQFDSANAPALVNDVQNWVNGNSNFGWMMKYDDEEAELRARGFFSRESAVVGDRPTLTVDFTAVPEPSSYLLMSLVAIGAAVWKYRHRRLCQV
jgi:hypothetical protein